MINVALCFSQANETNFHKLEIQGAPFNKKINVLFEDSIGFLWIGTNTGLYRYDGNNLVTYQYDVFDPYSIPNNSINSIVEDDNQNLWIGSESFLIHYNRTENKFKGFYKNITSTVLRKSSNGDIWANLKFTGLVKITPDKDFDKVNFDTHFNYENNSNLVRFERQINSFVDDNFERQWLGTPKGIFILNDANKYIQTNFKFGVNSIKLYGNNRIIAITNSSLYILGYNKTDYNLEILEHYEDFINSFPLTGSTTSIALSPNNENLWIGTTIGLFKAVRKNNSYEFICFTKETSNGDLINNQITSIIFDNFENLWIGSLKGINKSLGRTSIFNFNKVKTQNKLNNTTTNGILFYSENTVLIGMSDGLYRYNPRSNIYTKIQTGINNISHISQNHEKDKLLITSDNTLYESDIYKPNKNKLVLTEIITFERQITDLAVINKNEIWVSTWDGGINIINTKNKLSKFKKDLVSQLENNHTFVLLLSNDFNLWIGTRGEGLFKVDINNETIEEYLPSKESGLSSNAILSLYEDSQKNIWIGTRGGGLNQYIKNLNTFKNFSKSNELTSSTISAIEGDNQGNLWMSTHDGLVRFNVEQEKFIRFAHEDGIEESQFIFNSSSSNKTRNRLYFGCSDGFYTVNANQFSPKEVTPSTVITSFQTLGATKNNNAGSGSNNTNQININSEKSIVLPYNENNIAVNFSSLDFTTPSKNEYAYKLEGLNDYWVYTNASNRNANYNDLSPGDYTFKVKSSNSDGIWNEVPTELSFTIKPPFWASIWAILGYCTITIILLYTSIILVRRWYLLKNNLIKETIIHEKDNEHNRMKMIFFTDISHELRTPLTLILGTIEKIVKEKNFTLTQKTSQRIYNNSLRIKRLINQIMDIRKFDVGEFKLSISKNDIVKDIRTIKNAFNDFAKVYKIKYEFVSKEKEIIGWYDVDILEKILFNLLSNAFKYTEKNGEIKVSLELTHIDQTVDFLNLEKGDYIKCSVRDNGLGIPKKDLEFIFNRYYQTTKSYSNQIPGTGIGMELVQKLIERHYGKITVESEENIFTEFTFYLPLEKTKYNENERTETGTPLKRNYIKNSEYQIIEEVSSDRDAKINSKEKSKPRVLIVEDNTELRAMVKEELIDDFHVLEASNGNEGYECVTNDNPQLIISDILMPVEDGISMLRRIKENTEVNNIPIFMLTAKNSNETKIECLSLGADDYIEKPFSLEFVKWKIINAFSTRKQLKEKYSKVITAAPSEVDMGSNDEKFIKKLINIVENSMNDNLLSVEYLASEVGMSRANLYRKLQVILNDTPVNFIKKIKLKRAEQLLKNNDMYISEIAYLTGFNDQKYFGKCFQKEYGMSPTEYIIKYASKDKIDTVDLNLYQ
jgi:signal transduction histidine kinase/ligand-binding sensor domain-containing protein/AraC-like DNA-binding protein